MVGKDAIRAHEVDRIAYIFLLLSLGSRQDSSTGTADALGVRDYFGLQLLEDALVLFWGPPIIWNVVVKIQVEFPLSGCMDDLICAMVGLIDLGDLVVVHGPVTPPVLLAFDL